MAGAAFFDLDRTLLVGPSGPVLTEALVAAGIAPDRRVPGQGVLEAAYRHLGETLPMMGLVRAAALAAKGWPRSAVIDAAKQAAELLEREVAPYAQAIIDEHRAAGRPVVLATTTPIDLVRPLAERLGLDDVIATEYACGDDDRYTGSLLGEFVWAGGKAAKVKRWAAEHGIDLAESYAYSDSLYDLPLLSAVGHPHAVNPDPRLRVIATLRRWPVLFLDVPPGVPKLGPFEPFDIVRALTRPELFPYARFDISGVARIPKDGPAIIVGNHRSYFDPAAVGLTVMQSGRPLRFLGKKEVFDAPVIGPLAKAMGGIRVDRGSDSAGESLREAERALAAGELVAMMPQGTIPRGPAFFDPVLVGKTGVARLAAATGAPVIPLGLWGTEKVWPRSSKVPHVWNVTSPPTVRVRVGRAVAGLTGDDVRADTERVMAAVAALLPAEARSRRDPTPEELAASYPGGRIPTD